MKAEMLQSKVQIQPVKVTFFKCKIYEVYTRTVFRDLYARRVCSKLKLSNCTYFQIRLERPR